MNILREFVSLSCVQVHWIAEHDFEYFDVSVMNIFDVVLGPELTGLHNFN